MPTRYTFGKKAVERIRRSVRRTERSRLLRPDVNPLALQSEIYIGKTGGGGIPALSSDTPGSAIVTVYLINADGDLEAAKDEDNDDVTVTAYNLSDEAVAANTYVQLKQESLTAHLLVDFENC